MRLLALSLLLSACTAGRSYRPLAALLPHVVADRSAEGVSRGEEIFRGACEGCHREGGRARASGAHLADVPSFLGEFYSANLTRHSTAGVGAATDGELARAVRFGVNRRGVLTLMPSLAMGDADLAALLGFLRSDHPLVAADPTAQPPSRPSVLFRLGRLFLTGGRAIDHPRDGIPTPQAADTVEYGRYLAVAVYDCVGCHTSGVSEGREKAAGSSAFAGGFALRGVDGQRVVSANLTPDDETGLGRWTYEGFRMAVRDGVRSDRTVVRAPMPRLRHSREVELRALWTFLRSLPASRNAVADDRPAAPPSERTAAGLFAELGCATCHAQARPFHDKLVQARGRPGAELAQWILHPEKRQPGTMMPTYAAALSEADALLLADWISAGGVGQ